MYYTENYRGYSRNGIDIIERYLRNANESNTGKRKPWTEEIVAQAVDYLEEESFAVHILAEIMERRKNFHIFKENIDETKIEEGNEIKTSPPSEQYSEHPAGFVDIYPTRKAENNEAGLTLEFQFYPKPTDICPQTIKKDINNPKSDIETLFFEILISIEREAKDQLNELIKNKEPRFIKRLLNLGKILLEYEKINQEQNKVQGFTREGIIAQFVQIFFQDKLLANYIKVINRNLAQHTYKSNELGGKKLNKDEQNTWREIKKLSAPASAKTCCHCLIGLFSKSKSKTSIESLISQEITSSPTVNILDKKLIHDDETGLNLNI